MFLFILSYRMVSLIHSYSIFIHFSSVIPLLYKSVNLQDITLGCLKDETNEYSTKSLIFQALILFIVLGALKILFISIFVILWRNKLKGFLQRILQEIIKNNTWNILWTLSTIRLPHRPSDQVYYIVNWRILWIPLLVPGNEGKRGGHNSYIQEKNLNSGTSTATENKDFSADNSFSGNLWREASSSGRSMS